MNWEQILSSHSSRGKSPNSAEINGIGLLWPGIRRILVCLQVNALGLFLQPGKAADTVMEAVNISIIFGFQQCSSCQGAEEGTDRQCPHALTWEVVMRSQHFPDSGGQAASLPCTVDGILGKEMHIKAGDNSSVCIHKSRFCCALKELFF